MTRVPASGSDSLDASGSGNRPAPQPSATPGVRSAGVVGCGMTAVNELIDRVAPPSRPW
jgi:hypothetical protein